MIRDVVHVRSFQRTGPYRLRLSFTDGLSGEWDFSHLSRDPRPVTAPFRDPDFFDKVFLDFGALTWPNGFDWCPDALHADMKAAGVLSFEPATA